MENRHFVFITILVFLLTLISSNSSVAVRTNSALTGGWKPITNVTDSTVVDIGKFAVDEHNKHQKESLKFTKVVNGESQVVGGWNYNLTIKAKDGTSENSYVAIVWDKPWKNFRQLLSFKGPI